MDGVVDAVESTGLDVASEPRLSKSGHEGLSLGLGAAVVGALVAGAAMLLRTHSADTRQLVRRFTVNGVRGRPMSLTA